MNIYYLETVFCVEVDEIFISGVDRKTVSSGSAHGCSSYRDIISRTRVVNNLKLIYVKNLDENDLNNPDYFERYRQNVMRDLFD